MRTIFSLFFIFILVHSSGFLKAQEDTSQVSKPDTAIIQPVQIAQADTVGQGKDNKEQKSDKRKDEFIPYAGVNFNQISDLDTKMGIGYHIGFNYKRGKFFYWQVGARFNSAGYNFSEYNGNDTTIYVGIRSIDIPVTGGMNFLAFVNRVVALRLFVSAVPGFALGIGENDLGLEKDDLETFCLYGQGGIGINVAFLVIEAGYNYGFTNVFTNADSQPGQVFVNLGFRF